MKQADVSQPQQEALERDPFEVLQLLPTAPYELVVEVYWHVVHQLRRRATNEPAALAQVDEVNRAYAALVEPELMGNGPGLAASVGRRTAGAEATATKPARRTAWEVLAVAPSASPDVIDLAYNFWRVHQRSLGFDAEDEGEEVERAYQAIKAGHADSMLEADEEVAEAPAKDPGAGADPPSKAATPHRPVVSPDGRARRLAGRSARAARAGMVAAGRAGWRGLVALAVVLGRWARQAARAAWTKLAAFLKRWAADPFGERQAGTRRPHAAPPDAREWAPLPSVEERFAALAALRGGRRGPAGPAPEGASEGEAGQQRVTPTQPES